MQVRKFSTRFINVAAVCKSQFVIPTYQRPYVWGVEQIDKLIVDCAHAFCANAPYFAGTVLTETKDNKLELIDGQQRFTTIWLIAVVFHKKKIDSNITAFLLHDEELRIDFEIRKEVGDYFGLLVNFPSMALDKYTEEELTEKPYLQNITAALATIENLLDGLKDSSSRNEIDLKSFGDYLYTKLIMVQNTTPDQVDLNKLFATINNSGIQLEQSDILKSKLLSKITENVLYSKIWEACENMGDYFERNVKKIFQGNWKELDPTDLKKFDPERFGLGDKSLEEASRQHSTVEMIFANLEDHYYVNGNNQGLEYKDTNCRSIISFSQLLIHTYRIHLQRHGKSDIIGTFHVNRLIDIFRPLFLADKAEIESYFELLWEVRYIFDQYVIKWTSDLNSKEEYLELSSVNKNESSGYYARNILEKSALQMLQSVLYFTGDYQRQYWLTPYLSHLLDVDHQGNGLFSSLSLLESIDNELSISLVSDKEATFAMIEKIDQKPFPLKRYLNESLYPSFNRYWFQKLEYILWKSWPDRNDTRFRTFRITSKNSLEHIYPQQPLHGVSLANKDLHSFGNLVLLSVNQNSEYSRKDVNVKRIEFQKKDAYDSLKSKCIFDSYEQGDEWDADKITTHQQQMIELIVLHYDVPIHKVHTEEIMISGTVEDYEGNAI